MGAASSKRPWTCSSRCDLLGAKFRHPCSSWQSARKGIVFGLHQARTRFRLSVCCNQHREQRIQDWWNHNKWTSISFSAAFNIQHTDVSIPHEADSEALSYVESQVVSFAGAEWYHEESDICAKGWFHSEVHGMERNLEGDFEQALTVKERKDPLPS